MLAFDLVADLVGEEAADNGGHRRHQENAADDDAERRREREQPGQSRRRQVRLRSERRLDRGAAGPDQMHDQPIERDAGDHDQRQR